MHKVYYYLYVGVYGYGRLADPLDSSESWSIQ